MDTFLDAILNIAVIGTLITLSVILFIRSQTKGWIRFGFLCQLAMFPLALSIGENWYFENQSMLWLGGIEQHFMNRTDWGPAALLLLIGIIVPLILKWPVNFAGQFWTKNQKLPGTVSPYLIVGFFLVFSLYITASAGAYLNKAKESWVGNTVINGVCLSAGEGFYMAQDLTKEMVEKSDHRRKK